MNWQVTRLAKIKGLGVHMPHLNNGGAGLGREVRKGYATMSDECAAKLKKKLHCDLRQKMMKNRADRETRLPWCNQQQRTVEAGRGSH